METQVRTNPPGVGPGSATVTVDGRGTPPNGAPARRRISRALVLPVLAIVLLAVVGLAYRYWDNASRVVWTDNAQVSGALIQVGALNAGKVTAVLKDVGQTVQEGQAVARVSLPQPIAA